MLPKEFRLTRSRDFTRVRRAGRKVTCPVLALHVLSTPTSNIRVGFSVSKKVGKATKRNRVKRRMREAVRHRLPCLAPGQDLVFVARPQAAQASWADVVESVDFVLRKAGIVEPARAEAHNA